MKRNIQPEAFTFATICENEDFTVILVAESMQQLAAAWRTLTESKLNTAKVDKIEILPA